MADRRIRVALGGRIVDLEALDAELGGFGLCANAVDVVAVEGSPVTASQLGAAIAAHVPPAAPASIEDQVDALKNPAVDFAGFKAGLKILLGAR